MQLIISQFLNGSQEIFHASVKSVNAGNRLIICYLFFVLPLIFCSALVILYIFIFWFFYFFRSSFYLYLFDFFSFFLFSLNDNNLFIHFHLSFFQYIIFFFIFKTKLKNAVSFLSCHFLICIYSHLLPL